MKKMLKLFQRWKSAWKQAKKKETHYQIKDRDYILIGASAASGAIVSVLLSRIDFEIVKPMTGYPSVDFLIYAGLLTAVVVLVVRGVMKILHFGEVISEFQEILINKRKKKI